MMVELLKTSKKQVGDISINYEQIGAGEPLLLLHGYPQNLQMWSKVAPILAQNYTVICADLRGYGDSDKPARLDDDSNYSFRQMAHDNVALMKALGHERFHVVGHDRGGRTGHRMALDHPDAVASLSVLDIVPTHTMFSKTSRQVAGLYWHWYFLSQPAPFPEHMIALDPDFFYETCLFGWGATNVADFDPDQLDAYRKSWRNPEMIMGSCCDYRAGATIDFDLDEADLARKITCPTLVFYGSAGAMSEAFDIPEEWRDKCESVTSDSLPGGHFFVDQFPGETANKLGAFLQKQPAL